MRISYTFILMVTLALSCGDFVDAQEIKKSIVISIDGLGYGANGIDVAETPYLDQLRDGTWSDGYHGAHATTAFAGGVLSTATQQPTVSGPGWSTILTGVWVDRHGVTGNGSAFSNGNFVDNPPFIGAVKSINPDLVTVSFVNWGPIDSVLMHAVDTDSDPNNNLDFRGDYSNDLEVAQSAAFTIVGSLNPDVIFVAFDQVDGAGHAHGGFSEQYEQQIEVSDTYLGMILNQIKNRPNFDDEDWQIIVTSDHGHVPAGGHGGQSSLERHIPFIIASQSLTPGVLGDGVSHADVAPSVLDHFGFEIPKHYWGTSQAGGSTPDHSPTRLIIASDDFEGLALKPFTVASGGDGTDWTASIGSGGDQWTIDNSGMSGTTSELAYFGWTAMDVNSWIAEQGVQLGRSIFANIPNNTALVADPDAWDDFTTGAQQPGFNSYISRQFDLSDVDTSTLLIEYDYEFASEIEQLGVFEISFNDGQDWQTLQEFDSAAVNNNTIFTGRASFEAGVDFEITSDILKVRFGCLEAGNNWWFAVDNIELSIAALPGDVNNDGEINLLDVQPFVDALSTGTYIQSGDINEDGELDLLDVSLFVQLLTGN